MSVYASHLKKSSYCLPDCLKAIAIEVDCRTCEVMVCL